MRVNGKDGGLSIGSYSAKGEANALSTKSRVKRPAFSSHWPEIKLWAHFGSNKTENVSVQARANFLLLN